MTGGPGLGAEQGGGHFRAEVGEQRRYLPVELGPHRGDGGIAEAAELVAGLVEGEVRRAVRIEVQKASSPASRRSGSASILL